MFGGWSARRHRDIGVRFVAANVHPDHDTIATFRRDNLAAFGESFLQVLLLAKELKLVKVGLVVRRPAASSRPLRASTVR